MRSPRISHKIVFSEIQREGVDIDIFSLPSARAVLPYFGNAVSTIVRTKDGILAESRNDSPFLSAGLPMLMSTFWLVAVESNMRQQHFRNVAPAIKGAGIRKRVNNTEVVAFLRYLRTVFSKKTKAVGYKAGLRKPGKQVRRQPVTRATGA